MGSKAAILILGLLATVFLISSEVVARDLAEASSEKAEVGKEANEVGDAKYGGYTGHGGHGGGHGHGGHYGGGYCRHGCCGGYYGGRCGRCCSYAGEAAEAQTEVKPHN